MYDIPGREMKEAKTGRQTASAFTKKQVAKDKLLIENGVVDTIIWHFFPSGRSNTIGMTPALKKELKDANIPYIIHLP